MCVINIYRDAYPNGEEREFRQMSICQYGQPGRPCPTLSTLENPVRKIRFGEPTTEFIMTRSSFPTTPSRSSGGSYHRRSGGESSSEEGRRRRHSRRFSLLRPTREHRKERIIIADSPPTPRTPPQLFAQTFTAPSSPANVAASPLIVNGITRSRPIIVDERPLRRSRAPSVGAVIAERPRHRRSRSASRPRVLWDLPSISHASFDSRARRDEEREREERRRRHNEREEREIEREARRRLAERIAAQDAEIRRRPAVPVPPAPLRHRAYLRPVVDQSTVLQGMMDGMTLEDRLTDRALAEAAAERRRREERAGAILRRIEAQEEEEMKQRLRERQLPRRRFSVGPGYRRHRVLYDDGLYRWE